MPVNKLNNVNVNYLQYPKKHHGLHKTPSQATYGPRAACLKPWRKRLKSLLES